MLWHWSYTVLSSGVRLSQMKKLWSWLHDGRNRAWRRVAIPKQPVHTISNLLLDGLVFNNHLDKRLRAHWNLSSSTCESFACWYSMSTLTTVKGIKTTGLAGATQMLIALFWPGQASTRSYDVRFFLSTSSEEVNRGLDLHRCSRRNHCPAFT